MGGGEATDTFEGYAVGYPVGEAPGAKVDSAGDKFT